MTAILHAKRAPPPPPPPPPPAAAAPLPPLPLPVPVLVHRRRRRRRRRSLWPLVIALALALALAAAPAAAAAASAPPPDEEDCFWDVQPSTDLHEAISRRRWGRALRALRADPDEAGVLVVRRSGGGGGGGSNGRGGGGGTISERALPIHKVFAVDVTDDARRYDLPPAAAADASSTDGSSTDGTSTSTSSTSTDGMPPDQIELVRELLRLHPLGTRMADHAGRLPLHLAAYSVVSPPASVLRALMEAYNQGGGDSGDGDGGGEGGEGGGGGGGGGESSNPKSTKGGGGGNGGGGTDVFDGDGRTPLHAACSAPISTLDTISTLLEANPAQASVLSSTNANANSSQDAALPIHYAAWGGARHGSEQMVQIFQRLLLALASTSTTPEKNKGLGGLILMKATDGDGDTVLDIMVKYGRTDGEAFGYVLGVLYGHDDGGDYGGDGGDYDGDDNGEDNDNGNMGDQRGGRRRGGNTLLHNALAMAPHRLTANMVRSILDMDTDTESPTSSHSAQQVKQMNDDHQLPLHSALEHPGTAAAVIQMLLEAYPDSVRVEDGRTGRLPLHMACHQGVADVDAVRWLAEAYPAAVLMLDGDDGEEGRLPLHLALAAPARTTRGGGLDHNDRVIQFLLGSGPSASATVDGRTGMYPLHVAIQQHRSSTLVRAILEAYPDAATERVGADQSSALHMLASAQDRYSSAEVMEMARAILDAKPESARVLDGSGRLPLHLACDLSDGSSGSGSGKSKKQKQKKTTKKKTVVPEKNLVGLLLDAYQGGARVKDSEGNLPLHFAIAAFDADATIQLLEVYEGGAKDEERPLLNIACGSLKTAYEPYRGEEDSVDRILFRLLSIYPDAARIASEDGKLPLSILLDRPNILEHIGPRTFKSLLEANPEAVRHRVDGVGDYPLQKAVGNIRNSKDSDRSLAFVNMLMDAYPDVVREQNDRGVTLFQQVLTQAQGTAREFDVSKTLSKLAWRLYELYPGAVSLVDQAGHYPLHSLARIVGQTAGSSNRVSSWTPLFRDVLDADSALADVADNKGRPPLHILCFHLGDAAYDNEDGSQYERSAEFDDAVRTLIGKSSNVLRFRDVDGQSPIDLLNRELKGRSSTKLSQTLQFVKEEIIGARKKLPRKNSEVASQTTNDEL